MCIQVLVERVGDTWCSYVVGRVVSVDKKPSWSPEWHLIAAAQEGMDVGYLGLALGIL